jgi:hypothetical protein
VDHLPDGVLAGGHQPGNRQHRGAADAMVIVARRTRTGLFVDTAPDAWSEPHPAGRVNDRAGDPAAAGDEKGDDGGDVVRFAEPTQRRHALGGPVPADNLIRAVKRHVRTR